MVQKLNSIKFDNQMDMLLSMELSFSLNFWALGDTFSGTTLLSLTLLFLGFISNQPSSGCHSPLGILATSAGWCFAVTS